MCQILIYLSLKPNTYHWLITARPFDLLFFISTHCYLLNVKCYPLFCADDILPRVQGMHFFQVETKGTVSAYPVNCTQFKLSTNPTNPTKIDTPLKNPVTLIALRSLLTLISVNKEMVSVSNTYISPTFKPVLCNRSQAKKRRRKKSCTCSSSNFNQEELPKIESKKEKQAKKSCREGKNQRKGRRNVWLNINLKIKV